MALACGVNISLIEDRTRRPDILMAISRHYSALDEKNKNRTLKDIVKDLSQYPDISAEINKDLEAEGYILVDGELSSFELSCDMWCMKNALTYPRIAPTTASYTLAS